MRGKCEDRAGRAERGFAMIASGLAWALPMVPAVRINLDGAAGQGGAWVTFAIASVVFAAVAVEISMEAAEHRKPLRFVLYGGIAVLFLALNISNALGNSAAHSGHSREDRSAKIQRKQRTDAILASSQEARRAQAAIAGEATPEAIGAEIEARKAADARRWTATNGCDVSLLIGQAQRDFCAGLAGLEAKKAAAVKRDELDKKIASLSEGSAGAAPEVADPFADSIARLLTTLGCTVSEGGLKIIAASRDWSKAIGVEIMAAFGPAALLMLFAGSRERPSGLPVAAVPAERGERTPRSSPPVLLAAPQAVVPLEDTTMLEFIGRRLERRAGAAMRSGEAFRLWEDDCAEQGIEAGSQKAFTQRFKRHFAHDPNGGRPRFMGVGCSLTRGATLAQDGRNAGPLSQDSRTPFVAVRAAGGDPRSYSRR